MKRAKQLHFSSLWRKKPRKRGEKKRGRPKKEDAGVSHLRRAALASRHPVHVTLKLRGGLPRLRNYDPYNVVCAAFERGKERAGTRAGNHFRLVHFSVQDDHLHLVVEATDRLGLSRGVQGLAVRIARGLNRLWGRKGKVFGDRYHDRILRSAREVRNVLAYVLNNGRKHRRRVPRNHPDTYCSGHWFDGWKDYEPEDDLGVGPVAAPRTWLLSKAWRRQGLLRLAETPGGP